MSQANLFVALSTGQSITNILPILELAETGDQVLWVESATAKQQQWGKGACDVLRRHDISNVISLELPDDDPASLQEALRQHEALQNSGVAVNLIGNGGTKLQMLAAFRALNGHLDELLYSNNQPCILERQSYRQGRPEPVIRHVYNRHSVDLGDVLACNGREIVAGSERLLWPTQEQPPLTRYGTDEEWTRACHQRVADWAKNHPHKPKKAFDCGRACELAPEEAEKFRRQILDACGLPKNTPIKKSVLEDIYNRAHRLDREAWEFQSKHGSHDQEVPNLGRDFEDAVAARVVRWLMMHPQYANIVQSVWQNVKIRLAHGREDTAELDVALLLKNGVLMALECKSFDAQIKDMNSRLGELQRSASQLARIAICAPSYPLFNTDSWCRELIRNVERMNHWSQFKLIEFTLPNQPGKGQKTFEDALADWLKSLLPNH
jgi:hypothetical protein